MRFDTLLVANRGEIALRILRTARRMGLRTVAVYSDADAHSPHVRAADLAVHIGPAPADQSYRNGAALIEACRRSGAQAIHPGYGFLSENAEFAQAVADAGLVFVGPTARVIALMGNKAQAKQAMQAAGVPTVPGEQGCATQEQVAAAARRIGFPVILKAAAGGGGRGMRVVREAGELAEMFRQAQSEAAGAFGSDEIIIERAIERGRHIEVQVLCDEHGRCLHLGERDCSTQRRFQKLIEEAPSPAVDAKLREAMGQVARQACEAIGYTGVGTLEFLLDEDKRFYFMEMNTRLQVEHGVTELVTGLDLVEQQIRVAQSEALALRQQDVQLKGHAIELRLCAEDPWAGFLPQVGTVGDWQAPADIRTDSALQSGMAISPFYDSMVAKLMAWGESRAACIAQLAQACERTTALGVRTNQGFLARCLRHPRFAAGQVTTDFLAQEDLQQPFWRRAPSAHALAAAALVLGGAVKASMAGPEERLGGRSLWLRDATAGAGAEGRAVQCTLASGAAGLALQCSERAPGKVAADVQVASWQVGHLRWAGGEGGARLGLSVDGIYRELACWQETAARLWVQDGADAFVFERLGRFEAAGARQASGLLRAPMSGRVIAVLASEGQEVAQGDPLVVIESMKMEMPLAAPCAGRIARLHVSEGQQLNAGQAVLEVDSEQDKETS
ncbi:MAG: biotin/lipoyl-binding protein [Proteobacteria bacterium]|nr:biotin/lipoyl-binding protein [Pseudomonadota bacterium]